MSINIQGKPLKEWVEEQKKKDGVMIVHRGTQRTQFGTSTYQGAIVTLWTIRMSAMRMPTSVCVSMVRSTG